jgi:tRNA pseudouridine32 synthase/23S rRNA pseudouridine746 synthase/23S rRNA pseudouridine1911/1915/1917 synthase
VGLITCQDEAASARWDWPTLRATRVLTESAEYLVLDKPAGLSVAGERHETDLVRIARDAGEELIPVHRIDKVTSGAVLLAKTKAAHGPLTRQFAMRTVGKTYLVITRTVDLPTEGEIDLPLSVGRKNRVRVAAPRAAISCDPDTRRWTVPADTIRTDGFPSQTAFRRVWEGSANTVLVVNPKTGRRHQIRVHLAWIGHPLAGDPLFPAQAGDASPRTGLHAWRLEFDDVGGDRIRVVAPPGADFWSLVDAELSEYHRTELLSDPSVT